MKLTSVAFGVAVLFVVSTGAAAAELHDRLCGKTLRGGGHYTLNNDLTCGCGDAEADSGAALTLVGPITLDLCLGSHTVSCGGCEDSDRLGPGIVVEGTHAVVVNGAVSDCDVGIKVKSGSHHPFNSLTVAQNLREGIDAGKGGKHHRFLNLTLAKNARSGLKSVNSYSKFINNRALQNGRRGLEIEGDYNEVRDSLSVGNGREGILIVGDKNRLRRNHAWANVRHGIKIEGKMNKVRRNQTWSNGRQGILVESTGDGMGSANSVTHNGASGNCRDGIELEGGMRDVVSGNTVNRNGNPGACPEDPESFYGIDYRPWFYAGLDAKAGADGNRILHNRTAGNLGCWVPPNTEGSDEDLWRKCLGIDADDPDNPDAKLPDDAFAAAELLRNRNLWDENATEAAPYQCTSHNEWLGNRSDGEKKAKPECPCLDGVEGCDLAF